jgi:RNA polymerase sigma-70 factor (ECF subfamily)
MVHAAMDDRIRALNAPEEAADYATVQPFDDFFVAERDRLFSALCLVTHDRNEAEDLTQEAFVRVLERWDRVATMENPAGYLYRTAMNTFRKRYRRALLAARRTLGTTPPPDPLDAIELQDEAIRALATLTERQRAAIVLVDLLGYRSDEVAKMLGVRPATVRKHVSLARAALRQKVGDNT